MIQIICQIGKCIQTKFQGRLYSWNRSATWISFTGRLQEDKRRAYLFLLLSQSVPHGGDYLGYIAEGGVGILSFNGCLGVPEEQSVGWHGLGGLIGILLLLLFLGLGFGLHHLWRWPLLACDLEEEQAKHKTAYCHVEKQGRTIHLPLEWIIVSVMDASNTGSGWSM